MTNEPGMYVQNILFIIFVLSTALFIFTGWSAIGALCFFSGSIFGGWLLYDLLK